METRSGGTPGNPDGVGCHGLSFGKGRTRVTLPRPPSSHTEGNSREMCCEGRLFSVRFTQGKNGGIPMIGTSCPRREGSRKRKKRGLLSVLPIRMEDGAGLAARGGRGCDVSPTKPAEGNQRRAGARRLLDGLRPAGRMGGTIRREMADLQERHGMVKHNVLLLQADCDTRIGESIILLPGCTDGPSYGT